MINLSLTGPAPSGILKKAVNYAWNEGAVVVASGNTGDGTVQYPASYSNAIAVSATNRSDGRAAFSTLGDWVDVTAPGVGTLSTLPGGYGYMNGASMATSHVAALAAPLAGEGLSNGEIRDRILTSTVDRGPPRPRSLLRHRTHRRRPGPPRPRYQAGTCPRARTGARRPGRQGRRQRTHPRLERGPAAPG